MFTGFRFSFCALSIIVSINTVANSQSELQKSINENRRLFEESLQSSLVALPIAFSAKFFKTTRSFANGIAVFGVASLVVAGFANSCIKNDIKKLESIK